MGKDTPAQPTPPDPVRVAQAQSQYNREAAIAQANLDRIDQYTPQGSIRYTQIGTNSDGTPRYRQDQTYSPDQQALYDQNNQIAQSLGGLAESNVNRVAATQGQDFNYNGMTPMVTGVNSPTVGTYNGPTPDITRSLGDAGQVQSSLGSGGQIQSSIGSGGDIQRRVGANDLTADASRVANAVYGQATSRLDPQFNQQQSDITAKLASQGIPVGSEAYNREMDNFNRTRNDAYNQANFSAIQAGGNEQSRLFGLDMSQGQFANQAQAQAFGQGAQQGQFANEAQAQQFGQGATAGQFANQAQDQRYTQNLGAAEFYNNSGDQQLRNNLSATGFNNQAGAQQFNQDTQNANMNNAGRQQQIQEATYLRNLPLNDIAALLGTGGGVQNPMFSNVSQVGVAAPDYMGQVNNTYNAQMQQYNQAQAAQSQALGSIFGLAGSAAMAFSDRRLKDNIVRIGTLANGLATYAFNYIGSKARQFGVMAQEVLGVVPDAVIVAPSGHMVVDYRKVW
jgi:hypothetical protein